MQFTDRYPIIVTDQMKACRAFWVRHLTFEVVFENDWFVYLAAPEASASIAFMTPNHPSSPPGPEPYTAGISMELEVADAAAALAVRQKPVKDKARRMMPKFP